MGNEISQLVCLCSHKYIQILQTFFHILFFQQPNPMFVLVF